MILFLIIKDMNTKYFKKEKETWKLAEKIIIGVIVCNTFVSYFSLYDVSSNVIGENSLQWKSAKNGFLGNEITVWTISVNRHIYV